MNTLSDLLRAADPLRDDAPRNAEARRNLRRIVVSAPRGTTTGRVDSFRRTLVVAVIVGLAGAGVAKFAWRHASVDAVAAMRFEARLAAAQESIVDNRDILTARVVPGGTPTTFGVALTFTPEGAEKMRAATEAHIGEHLDLLVDGDVVLSPVIRSAISTSAALTGDYTYDEAVRIAEGLLKRTLEVRGEK